MRNSIKLFLTLSLLSGALAHAQTAGTVTFTVNKTSAVGSLVPVLTWSTSPVASRCVASGAWTGTKFASGSETLAQITASKSYTLTCYWNNGTANLTWTAPKTNTDNSALTDLVGYKLLYGTSSTSLAQSKAITGATVTSTTVGSLAGGTWYFALRAVNSKQLESDNSNVAQRSIATASAAKTVAVTITAGTIKVLKTVATPVYDVKRYNNAWTLRRVVGSIPLGKLCLKDFSIPGNYFAVNASDVKLTLTPRSTRIVAKCSYQ
jgi:hypothetical protein